MTAEVPSRTVLRTRVDATSYADATERIVAWAKAGERGYVCAANVHMVMEGWDSPDFQAVVNGARLVTPDGMPLVFMLRRQGLGAQSRVYGPDLMLHLCEAAARDGVPIGLFGATDGSLSVLQANLSARFPALRIAYAFAPPFRPLTDEEDALEVGRIRDAGVRLLFVGLGCPKQERWMAAHADRLDVIQVGVGAAFDFHAGRVRQSPAVLQRLGLEWAFRFAMEPRRLWRRYLRHNPRFVALATLQLLGKRWSPDA